MKTEQIFQEFEQRLEKEYYAQLASKEILTVPLLIEIFLDDDYAKALCGNRNIGNVAPTASMKITVLATKVLEKNISCIFIYLSCSSGLFAVCKHIIRENTMLYANFPGIIGSNAGIYSTVIGQYTRFPSHKLPNPITNPPNKEAVAISTPK